MCIETMESGFMTEEVHHAAVAVEEPPLEAADNWDKKHSKPTGVASYNRTQSSKNELLITLFLAPCDDVHHSMLSHNHILMVARAFLTSAKWEIPDVPAKNLFLRFGGQVVLGRSRGMPQWEAVGRIDTRSCLMRGASLEDGRRRTRSGINYKSSP